MTKETSVVQRSDCHKILEQRLSTAIKDEIRSVGQCVDCRLVELGAGKRRRPVVQNCRFRNLRTFVFTSGGKLKEVHHHERSGPVTPRWGLPPSEMTAELVRECLTACASILIPELTRHLALRQESARSLRRTPQLDYTRSYCDYCRTSILCCAHLCELCGREVCDACMPQYQGALCIVGPPARCHQFVFIDAFQPGELEHALGVLRAVEPLPRPPIMSEFLSAGPIRVQLTDGSGLPSYSQLYGALAAGVPMLISGLDEQSLTPDLFIRAYGSEKVKVINTATEDEREDLLGKYMATFKDPAYQGPSEKIKDFPPSDDFRTRLPDIFARFENCLPGPMIMTADGNLNLESSMPPGSNPPDTGPKAYLAHGAGDGVSTYLHTDWTDAINICFYAGQATEGSAAGALWTTIHRDDMDKAEAWLRREKIGEFSGHPVHSQTIHLKGEDVDKLVSEGIRASSFIQKQGEATVIPAGVYHQVANLSPCIKVAKDAIVPSNILHSAKMSRQLREHRLETKNHKADDLLQLSNMCWWFLQRSQTPELQAVRSDPDSNPWISTVSAAPRALRTRVKALAGVEGASALPVIDPQTDDFGRDEAAHDDPMNFEPAFTGTDHSSLPRADVAAGTGSALPLLNRSSVRAPLDFVQGSTQAVGRVNKTRKRNANAQHARDAKSQGNVNLRCPFGRGEEPGWSCKRREKCFENRYALLSHVFSVHRQFVSLLNEGLSDEHISQTRCALLGTEVDDLEWIQLLKRLLSANPLR